VVPENAGRSVMPSTSVPATGIPRMVFTGSVYVFEGIPVAMQVMGAILGLRGCAVAVDRAGVRSLL
jgi:hypothetical protein